MRAPTLLFCIGATKAGTTWLYDYLSSHPECHLHAVKELHYFDTRGETGRNNYLRHADDRIENATNAAEPKRGLQRLRGNPVVTDLQRWQKVLAEDDDTHARYWAYMKTGAKGARLVADITPCYSTLSRDDFAQMAAVTKDVRFVFLMRDPVDRAWSHARMQGSRRTDWTRDFAERERVAQRVFARFVSGGERKMFLRSNYARTLTELFAVVPREQVHVAFYEDLFTQHSVDALCDFLGLSPHPAAVDKVVFSGKSMPMPQKLVRRAVNRLADQYAYCETLFDGYLPGRWRSRLMKEAS